MIKDYRVYEFNRKEKLSCFMEGLILNGVISLIFYNSFYAMIPGMILVFFYFKEKKRMLVRYRMHQMQLDLKEFLNALVAALQTGRSLENAFVEATKDTARYTGKDTEFVIEMKQICAKVSVGESIEKLISEFSGRSHMEELEYFSEVLSIAKRSGGNIIGIMKNTIHMIQEKMDVTEEIAATIAEKQFEFQIMSVIPLAIILYLRVSAGNLVQNLYGNFTGAFVMTICLIIFGGCYLYGKKLLEIEH